MAAEDPLSGMHGFPGADLVRAGLLDLARGETQTVEALLVSVGAPRLQRLGIELPEERSDEPEAHLYDLLHARHGNGAHSRYNSLIRRLVSFERAAEHAATR